LGVTAQLDRGRLIAWTILVSSLALLGYASRASGGKPPANAAYQYTTAIGGIVQYGVILAIVLLIARPEWRRLALHKPTSYGRAMTTALGVLVVVYVISAIVSALTDPGQEQGLTPDKWDPHRITPYVVNFIVFVGVAPFVEELTFRGLGYSVLEPLGRTTAILWIGVAFGLAHGLLEALPILIAFGAGLALIRARTDSVYPGMVVHALFNAVALIVSVST
jgi:uncharacterized protein